MKHYLIALVVACLALASVTAAVYTSNATNHYIYESFDSDFDQSRWFNYSASTQDNIFRVEGGQLIYQCDYENTTALNDALYLTDPDFIMHPDDEWTITFNASSRGTTGAERMWVSFNSNTTTEPYDYNLAQEYYYVTLNGVATLELHAMQGIDLHERYNVVSGSGRMTTSMKEFSFVKRNIPENNTWYIEAYEEGSLIYNDSSIFHGSSGACGTEPFCPRTTDNFTYSDLYFAFGGFSATADQDWQMDYFELSVDRAYTCTPDWVCSGYGSCNTSDLAACNNVTDLNTCGDVYGGDYSEFTAQACNYCVASVALFNQTECVANAATVCYHDSNFLTCCDVTGLPSDCPQATEYACGNETCGIFTYEEDDMPLALINTIAKFFISGAGVIVIVVVFALGGWAYDSLKKK